MKNANHMEKLMNNLKLTYQLEAGAVPFAPLEPRIVRFLKELFIDIANDPAFLNREIEFESSLQELKIAVDPGLMRRAVGNIVINALVHNPADTKVRITVSKSPDSSLSISICDNGNGMDEAELSGLWSRYYRGTNTKGAARRQRAWACHCKADCYASWRRYFRKEQPRRRNGIYHSASF